MIVDWFFKIGIFIGVSMMVVGFGGALLITIIMALVE